MFITHSEYLTAKKTVDQYNLQLASAKVSLNDIQTDQKLKIIHWDDPMWVSEIEGEDILIRTTEDEQDPNYNDYWINIAQVAEILS